MTGIRPIRIIRRMAYALAGLTATVLAPTTVAPSAFAIHVPAPGGSGTPARAAPHIHTITTGGMPGWQITLIALGAALVAATLAVVLDRTIMARRRGLAHPA
jgi:hypothetical protein